MCDKCFNSDIDSFPSEADFLDFDFELTKKIANEKNMRMKEFVNLNSTGSGYYVYECLACGQLWKLSTPDYSDRGYFLQL